MSIRFSGLSRLLIYISFVVLMGNLYALVDLIVHPQIPYFHLGHMVAGSITAILGAVICAMLENNVIKGGSIARSTNMGPFTWFLATGWTIIIFASLFSELMQQQEQSRKLAMHEARTVYEKDLNYYRWATGHEGVFVPITEKTRPNPYLKHVPEYKVTTSTQQKLTLVNPEYMIRQVYEMDLPSSSARGHITSLDPIRAENAADPWEKDALEAFERGVGEVSSIEEIDGAPYLRLMKPMVTEEGCMKCHARQGYEPGDIRGGISISIPMAHLYELKAKEETSLLLGHIGIWVMGLIGIFLGSNRIRQSIIEREQAEARTHAIIDHMFDGLITVEEDGTIATLNSAAGRMFGVASEDVVGTGLDTLIVFSGQTSVDGHADLVGEIIKSVDNSQDLIGRKRSGDLFPIQVAVSRMIFGKQVLYIVMVRDITEEKIRKAEALQAGKLAAIGELAAGVAHEINNPINGVINYAQLLYDDIEDGESTEKDLLSRIIKEGDRVASIVRNLLSFARQRDEESDELNIRAIVEDSISLVKHQFHKDGIEVVVEIPDDLPGMKGNPQQLQQVFLNLLSNARYALNDRYKKPDSGKRVEVKSCVVGHGKKYVRTTVTDFGTGIPQEDFDHIFDSLFSTKPPGEGTGLGLSISRDLVDAHNGHLHIDTVVNDHTVATVDLPVTDG